MAWTTVSDRRPWPKNASAATKRLVTSDRSAHSKSDFWFDEATLCSYISSPLPIISSDNNQVPDSSSTLELNVSKLFTITQRNLLHFRFSHMRCGNLALSREQPNSGDDPR
ncbi:hypothetical protein ACJ73_02879 [Blastomyces percursus]|uniref:Uncharacterized protein n=1 Tax=Blastomyces percursus TaxID=1658174 RepID=A0A1J9R009_9EURO|nr:hypothetical protein ACJ73_02879 [Blastomyces percursus]